MSRNSGLVKTAEWKALLGSHCSIWFVCEADLSESQRRDLPDPKSHL